MSDEGAGDFWTAELREMIAPGRAVRVDFGPGGLPAYIDHIRAVVDGDQVVAARHIRGKGWTYRVEPVYWYWILQRDGHLSASDAHFPPG